MLYQQAQAWTTYWMNLSQLCVSSSEVVARRSLLGLKGGVAKAPSLDFDGMASEKIAAATEAWGAMAAMAFRMSPLALGAGWVAKLFSPRSYTSAGFASLASEAMSHGTDATLRIVGAGMKPVQRRVHANTKRLR